MRWPVDSRKRERGGPYPVGQSIGLDILSPVDVRFEPLDEVQFRCPEGQLAHFMSEHGIVEVWPRDGFYIGFRQVTVLRLYDFAAGDHWEAMFIPNGDRTIEWRLGFDVELPDEYGLLVCPPADPVQGLTIPYGYLCPQVAVRSVAGTGFSLAVFPTAVADIRKG